MMALRATALLCATAAALLPAAAAAHDREPLALHDLRSWQAWPLEPAAVLAIAVPALLYARAAVRMRRARGLRAAAFGAALLALTAALLSPLEPLSAALLSAHMVQHLLLTIVAAPLLVLARPGGPLLHTLPRAARRAALRAAKRPGLHRAMRSPGLLPAAGVLHAAVLLAWHVPALYEAALAHAGVHAAEHGSLLATAVLFWWAVLGHGARGRLGYGRSVLALFALASVGLALGALMAFSPTAWYPAYSSGTEAWGVSLVGDQRTGGFIMWMAGGLAYALGAVALVVAWLAAAERETSRREDAARRAAPATVDAGRWET